jgi:hypothetical protein
MIKVFEIITINTFQSLCEKALVDIITPANVASLLLVADTFECDHLKKSALAYCEENSYAIVKTVAWKVMEEVGGDMSYVTKSQIQFSSIELLYLKLFSIPLGEPRVVRRSLRIHVKNKPSDAHARGT